MSDLGPWGALLLGCLGGLTNLALSKDFFAWPSISASGFRLGFLNPILIGGVAALATFWLGDLSKLDFGHQAGLSLAAGISGATVIAGLSQRRRAVVAQARTGFHRDLASGLNELDDAVPEGGDDPEQRS
jgi:hypothetical protein